MDTQDILTEHQDIFSMLSNFFVSIFRFCLWWLIRGLSFLSDELDKALDVLFENLNFFGSAEIGMNDTGGGLYGAFKPLFFSLLTVGIIIVGYLLMTNKLKNKINVPINLVLCIVLMVGMPTILNVLSGITTAAVQSFRGDSSFMDTMIKENVTDLSYLDEQNFSDTAIAEKNNFNENGSVPLRKMVDPMATIDYGDANNKDVFKHELVVGTNGELTIEKNASKNFLGFTMFDKLYYRYQINWLTLTISAVCAVVAIAMIGVKVGKHIFDLTFTSLFFMLVAPLDISSGERMKKVMNEIINIFVAIIGTVMVLRLYGIAMNFAVGMYWLAGLIFQIAVSAALIAGPPIVKMITNKDAGLGSEMQSLASGMYMASGAGRAIKSGARTVGGVVKGVGKAGAAMGVMGAAGAGAVAGGISNAKEHYGKKPQAGSTEGEYTVLGKDNGGIGSYDGNQVAIGQGETQGYIGDGSAAADAGDGPATPPPSGDDGSGGATIGSVEDVGATSMEDAGASDGGEVERVENADSSGVAAAGTPSAPLDTKMPNREDTIGGALGKMVGSTRAAQGVKKYAEKVETAYQIGKNTSNKGWEDYKNQVPHVHAEEMPDKKGFDFSNRGGRRSVESEETSDPASQSRPQRKVPARQQKKIDKK